ncbi:MAG: hypothetical protein ACHQUC_03955 [Chlamydiales bacterium]
MIGFQVVSDYATDRRAMFMEGPDGVLNVDIYERSGDEVGSKLGSLSTREVGVYIQSNGSRHSDVLLKLGELRPKPLSEFPLTKQKEIIQTLKRGERQPGDRLVTRVVLDSEVFPRMILEDIRTYSRFFLEPEPIASLEPVASSSHETEHEQITSSSSDLAQEQFPPTEITVFFDSKRKKMVCSLHYSGDMKFKLYEVEKFQPYNTLQGGDVWIKLDCEDEKNNRTFLGLEQRYDISLIGFRDAQQGILDSIDCEGRLSFRSVMVDESPFGNTRIFLKDRRYYIS